MITGEEIHSVSVQQDNKKIPITIEGKMVAAVLNGASCGEKKISYEINGRKGETFFT